MSDIIINKSTMTLPYKLRRYYEFIEEHEIKSFDELETYVTQHYKIKSFHINNLCVFVATIKLETFTGNTTVKLFHNMIVDPNDSGRRAKRSIREDAQ